MNAILEDLASLKPKRLEKRLEALAREALTCHSVTVFDGNPEDGLTVALRVDARDRGDVLDLARVIEDDPNVFASCGWSSLGPGRREANRRLLLRVSVERPAICAFAVVLAIGQHPNDPLRASLPLLLAANRFVFDLDGKPAPKKPLLWLSAPTAHECVLDLLLLQA